MEANADLKKEVADKEAANELKEAVKEAADK